MSLLQSGLWCDLCAQPILDGDWWHISVGEKPGHSCQKCKEKYEHKLPTPKPESEGEFQERINGVSRTGDE